VPVQVARERNRVLRELAAAKKREFMRSCVGQELAAITLTANDRESTEALTDNYLKMTVAGKHESNQWMMTRVEDVHAEALVATVV
jgi:tRNA A37 methylthiotransferase MiaB